jgi:hypothetical protein
MWEVFFFVIHLSFIAGFGFHVPNSYTSIYSYPCYLPDRPD